jgi:uncharacterized protein YjbJ (UPF0337 family)
MRNDILKAQWKQVRGRVQQMWGELTDDDLARINGNWDQLVGKVEEKTGLLRADIENRLTDLWEQFKDATRAGPPHPATD